jgi:hypothetical protein
MTDTANFGYLHDNHLLEFNLQSSFRCLPSNDIGSVLCQFSCWEDKSKK